MAGQVSHTTLLSTLGGAVPVVLALSGACDKAIEQRITAQRALSISERDAIEQRIERLERWHDGESE